jgi:hypothetical protein
MMWAQLQQLVMAVKIENPQPLQPQPPVLLA